MCLHSLLYLIDLPTYLPIVDRLQDELLWAATWLYRATEEACYLQYVIDNAVAFSGTTWAVKDFSWDNKFAGLQTLLSKVNDRIAIKYLVNTYINLKF